MLQFLETDLVLYMNYKGHLSDQVSRFFFNF